MSLFCENSGYFTIMDSAGLLGGRYEVRDVLGFGATAEVCDGWDTRMSRPVAVKLLRRGLSAQPAVRQRFQVEARAAAALNHPNIVRVYDIGNHEDTPFIVMERLSGETFGDQIARGPLPESQVRAVLHSVLAALSVAHDAGMLHRDIKPGNLLLTPSGTVKVADFGIVKTAASVHTTTGHIVGTLAYMSPDRVGGRPASVADDLYAVGVVGYEALTGRKPFPQEDIMPLALAISEGRRPSVEELCPDIDPSLADVIERAMSPDPLRRFGSADAMRRALNGETGEGIALERPVPATAYAASPASVKRSPRRALEVAGSAIALGAMALAVLAFTSDPSSTPATAPGNFSVSTPAPSPIGLTEVPRSTAPTAPSGSAPVVVLAEAERPAPTQTVERATPREVRVSGSRFSGGGPSNTSVAGGGGNLIHDDNRANLNRPRGSSAGKAGSANGDGNKGRANGNRANGKPK